MNSKGLGLVFIIVSLLGSLVLGQNNSFSLSKGEKNWKYLETNYFDIFYYGNDLTAKKVAFFAEKARLEIHKTLDYKNDTRYALHVYMSSDDYVRSNRFQIDKVKTQGKTFLKDNIGQVVYSGETSKLYSEIKKEFARLTLEEFFYGGGIQVSIQKGVLLHTPTWFMDGLSSYMGEGWTNKDDYQVSNNNFLDIVNKAIEGKGMENNSLRKSIWYFIASEYGDEKLSEIFYMTRLTRSVEAGIITVLGITLKTFTDRWREFLIRTKNKNKTDRLSALETSPKIPFSKKGNIQKVALNPQQDHLAISYIHKGKYAVLVYDRVRKTFTDTKIKEGFLTDQYKTLSPNLPLSWDGEGERIVSLGSDKKRQVFLTHNINTSQSVSIPFPPGLEFINTISPGKSDKGSILCSGLVTGKETIFYFSLVDKTMEFVFQSDYELSDPVMDVLKNRMYFSSNMDTSSAQSKHIPNFSQHSKNIFAIDLSQENQSPWPILIDSRCDYKVKAVLPSEKLLVETNEIGLNQLKLQDLSGKGGHFLTNISGGARSYSVESNYVAFVAKTKGKESVYLDLEENVFGQYNPSPTHSWEKMEEEKEEKISIKEREKRRKERLDLKEKQDTTSINSKQLKYYVFDEEDNKSIRRENKIKRLQVFSKKEEDTEVALNMDSLLISDPKRASLKFATDYVATLLFDYNSFRSSGIGSNTSLRYDGVDMPAFNTSFTTRLPMMGAIGFKDLQNNHLFSISARTFLFDFKNNDFLLDYSFQKYRVKYFASVYHKSRHFFNLDFQQRNTSVDLEVGALYPLNRFAAVHARFRASYLNRINLNPFPRIPLEGKKIITGGDVGFRFDNTQRAGWEVLRGLQVNGGLLSAFGTPGSEFGFVTAKLDARYYVPYLRKMIFVVRGFGGISLGKTPQKFQMGGVSNSLFAEVANAHELPLMESQGKYHFSEMITPLRGFSFNARNGSRYFGANMELRVQVLKLFLKNLNSNSIYNFTMIPFFDVGTIWSEGNPFSQTNPISSDPIILYPLTIYLQSLKSPFLMATGLGSRITLFGYSIRADLAWGLDDYTFIKPRVHVSFGKKF